MKKLFGVLCAGIVLTCSLLGQAAHHQIPNDPGFGRGSNLERIHAAEAWAVNTDCTRVLIGIVGNGVDILHPDLAPNIYRNSGEIPGNGIDDDHNGFVDDVSGWNFWKETPDVNVNPSEVYFWHDTFVAGIIGARGDNGIGIAGVCWKARIVVAKRHFTEYSKDPGAPQQTANAIEYLIHIQKEESSRQGHSIPMMINNSYPMFVGIKDWESHGKPLKKAIDDAKAAGILMVFAATNGSASNDTPSTAAYPAAYRSPNVIAVAATNADDTLSKISNYGHSVPIAAPGIDIYSTTPNGQYQLDVAGHQSFTSFSTPQVTAALALYWSLHPQYSYKRVKKALLLSADHIDCLPVLHGNRLNVGRMLSQY